MFELLVLYLHGILASTPQNYRDTIIITTCGFCIIHTPVDQGDGTPFRNPRGLTPDKRDGCGYDFALHLENICWKIRGSTRSQETDWNWKPSSLISPGWMLHSSSVMCAATAVCRWRPHSYPFGFQNPSKAIGESCALLKS